MSEEVSFSCRLTGGTQFPCAAWAPIGRRARRRCGSRSLPALLSSPRASVRGLSCSPAHHRGTQFPMRCMGAHLGRRARAAACGAQVAAGIISSSASFACGLSLCRHTIGAPSFPVVCTILLGALISFHLRSAHASERVKKHDVSAEHEEVNETSWGFLSAVSAVSALNVVFPHA